MVSEQFHLDKLFDWGWWTVHSQSFCLFLFDSFLGVGTARVSFDEREVGTYWWSCVCPLVSIPCMSEARKRNVLHLACAASGPEGGGGTPLYKPCRYVPPQRVGFFLKTGVDFAHFGLESCMKELSCVSMCSSFQLQMNKKESVTCEFEIDFKKPFFAALISAMMT